MKYEVEAVMRDMIAEVERCNDWAEDHQFHWLPLTRLQLLSWPPRLHPHLPTPPTGLGMPLCRGDWAWLVDPQNAQPPQLAQVSRWFSNGHVELALADAPSSLSGELRVVKPEPGIVLSLDDRRPRYIGEVVSLWRKMYSCSLRGSEEEIKEQAASATTCPDYRPLSGNIESRWTSTYGMETFDGLGGKGNYADTIDEVNLESSEALLEGRSKLAVVTAVHPRDIRIISDEVYALPRQWQGDRRTNSTKDHWETGNGEYCSGTRRLGGKKGISRTTDWTIGSVDLQIFDARSGTFTGPELYRVPLFFVNGAGNTASFTQAKLVAQAEAALSTCGRRLGLRPP
jgi:hypothetical protein